MVHINEYIASKRIPFEKAKNKVIQDWKTTQKANVNEALYDGLLNMYSVTIKDER